MKETHIQEASL